MAMKNARPATAIVLNLPIALCLDRNNGRPDRRVNPEVVEKQAADLAASLPGLELEGFRKVYVIDNAEDIDSARILRDAVSG
jgi:predicted kinase